MPWSSASCFISSIVTGMPALRKFIAMPPPIVPAPITATFLIARSGVSSGTSGILLAARSAKKAWRSALRLGREHQRQEELALVAPCRRRTSSSTDAATASTHFSGAGKFFAIAPTVLRANWK